MLVQFLHTLLFSDTIGVVKYSLLYLKLFLAQLTISKQNGSRRSGTNLSAQLHLTL